MPDLMVLCPTRWRRANLERFLASFDASREADTDLLVIIDDDDDSYDEMTFPDYADVYVGPNQNVGSDSASIAAVAVA